MTILPQIEQHINLLNDSYKVYKTYTLKQKITLLKKLRKQLISNKERAARAITSDMNKPVAQALAEVEKCATLFDYYIENASEFLKDEVITTRWSKSFVRMEPLGVLLGVMPWNFPFWQVYRFVIPNLLLGNVVLLKHASNVPESAALLEELFAVDDPEIILYKNIFLESKYVEDVIAHPAVQAVSLTGSESAGKKVAEVAGKHLKKCVLELGGSNAFIICDDADLELAVETAVNARMQNAGQSCIAAKRFLVHKSLVSSFVEQYKSKIETLKTGDKYDTSVQIGSMAREDLAEELEELVQKSIEAGAKLVTGGQRRGAFYPPTLLTDVTPEMPVFREETFGPVAVVIAFSDFDEAVRLSNNSCYGLGVSIFTKNSERLLEKIHLFEEGAVFINEMVISDPKLPFGGIKKSGYGRELSKYALYEFANIKTVVVKR